MTSYPLGKLPAAHLAKLLEQYKPDDPAVIVGPRIGEDTAVLALDADHLLVAKTDPITFATDEIGWYAVNVNANDVACSGARPRWWLATVLLPEGGATPDLVDTLFGQMAEACAQVGAQMVGGHTEITYGIDRPLVVGVMLGTVPAERLVTTAGAQPGDILLLTKGIAVEGTAIIAREKRHLLMEEFDADLLDRCAGFLHRPGISVVRDAEVVAAAAGENVHAMHDPTEGGLATGLHELSAASTCGLEINMDQLPILPETRRLCSFFGLDPLGLIASGSLLAALRPDSLDATLDALAQANIPAAPIGRVLEHDEAVWLVQGTERKPLPHFDRDEIARLY